MQNVITPLFRRGQATTDRPEAAAKHRREGYFDDQDRWHDAEETASRAAD